MRSILLSLILGVFLSQTGFGAAAYTSQIEIRNGFIVIQASVNGKTGLYILDTGAPGLILNNRYFGNPNHSSSDQLQGVNGSVVSSQMTSWTFHWNQFEISGAEALAIDLSYLENAIGSPLDGLVGLDVFTGYYILIDYSNQLLELWTALPATFHQTPSVTLPLQLHEHVPIVLIHHDNRSFRFALDSGSRAHLLDAKAADAWNTSVTHVKKIELVGADQNIQQTVKIEATGLSAMGISLPPTQFIVTDLSHLSLAAGTYLDGVLGQPLLNNRTVLIDKDRKFLKIGPQIQGSAIDEPMASIN